MSSKLLNWIDERLPIKAAIKSIMEEDIPGGASYFYALGSALLFVFIIQVITGVWQLFYYVPTTDHAYTSLSYLQTSVPFGWLIHGLHYWGAQAMIVIVGLHMIQVFLWGAYKHPRQLTWLLGVFLLIMTAAMSFTGALLPWDEVGYFASKVGTNMASTVPFIGMGIKHFLLGGTTIGQLTLTRFFVFHVAIIPAIMVLFVLFHLMAFRKSGSAGPWNKAKHSSIGPFWPDQVYKDIVISVFLLVLLIVLTVYVGAPFSGPADPLDNSYHPVPEWNFHFLFQALKVFKGDLEPLGTVVLPILLILFIASIPFIDKKEERSPLKRPLVMGLFFAFTITILILTIVGGSHVPKKAKKVSKSSPQKTAVAAPKIDSAKIKEGQSLFAANGCIACHSINGAGGSVGPNLSHEKSKGRTLKWLQAQIKNSKSHNPASIMPSFESLPDSQILAISDYLLSVDKGGPVAQSNSTSGSGGTLQASQTPQNQQSTKGFAASYIGNPEHGAILFRQTCEGCHGVNGVGKVPNPGSDLGTVPALNPISRKLYDSNAVQFIDNIDPIIQNGATQPGPSPALHMPDFGKSNTLTQQQIAQVEAYILSINGVNRAQIQNPGIKPKTFMNFTFGVFALTALFLLFFWITKKKTVKDS